MESPIRSPLNDLRLDIVSKLSMLVMVSSGFAIWRAINAQPLSWYAIAALGVIFGLGWLVRKLAHQNPGQAKYLLVGGGNLSLILAVYFSPNPYLPFLAILVAFISSILLSRGELITASCLLIEIVFLNRFENRAYPLFELSVLLLFTIILSWLMIQTIYTALDWYSITYGQVKKLLEETRSQRADLKRALKSLEAAYKTQQRIQQDLIEARKQAESAQRLKERFAANISHELRTPLNLIFGFSEVMYFSPEVYGDVNWPPLLSRDVYQIYRSSRHLMEMIDDILDLSYFEQTSFTIHVEPTAFGEFIQDTVELAKNFFRDQDVRFEVNIQPDLPTIDIDRTRIRQVILNLLNNARRFTTAGYVRLEAHGTEEQVEVSIIDTGSGIAPEQLPLIFNEFYQVDYSLSRKHGGAGLGLAISKRFVEAHNGRISAESQLGIGSKFTFVLPCTLPESPQPVTARTGQSDQSERLSCLLVVGADSKLLRQMQRYMPGYQMIPITDDLPQAIREHQPKAVIYNEDVPRPDRVNIPVPCVYCSLPTQIPISSDFNITGSLSKPLTYQRLLDELMKLNGIRSVLIIDDDPGFVQLIERFLQKSPLTLEIYRAYTGQAGLEIFDAKSPDLVLVDMIMPEMDGMEVIQQIRRRNHNTPVILLTAISSEPASENRHQFSLVWSDRLYPAEIFQSMGAAINTLKQRYIE